MKAPFMDKGALYYDLCDYSFLGAEMGLLYFYLLLIDSEYLFSKEIYT